MYYLLIEIAGYRQLLKVNRDGLVRLVRDLCSALEYSGGTVHIEENGTVYGEFRSSSSHDLGRIVHGAYKAYEILMDNRQDLHGFSMVMEYLRGAERSEAHRRMNVLLQNAAVESCFWIGSNASADFAQFLRMQRKLDMWRVEGIHDHAVVLPDFAGFVRDSHLVEPLCQQITDFIETLSQADRRDPGLTLVYGVPGSGVFAIVREIAACLSSEHELPVPECIASSPDDTELSAFQALGLHPFMKRVPEFLSEYERELWENIAWVFHRPFDQPPGSVHPDSLSHEFTHALTLFLRAFVTKCAGEGIPAVFVLQRVEKYSSEHLRAVARAVRAAGERGALCVLASSYTAHIPAPLREFQSIKLATRALDPAAISEFLGNLPPHLHRDASSRVRILTRGRALQLYQYLWMIERVGQGIEHIEQRDRELDDIVVSVLNEHEMIALYLASIATHFPTTEELSELLSGLNVPKTLSRDIWKSLSSAGLVYSPVFPYPTSEKLTARIAGRLAEQTETIRLHVQNELYRMFATGLLGITRGRYKLLCDHPEPEVRLHVLKAYLTTAFHSAQTDIVDAASSGDLTLPVMNDSARVRREVERQLYVLTLARVRDLPSRTKITDAGSQSDGNFSAWSHFFSAGETDQSGGLLLERSRWLAAHGSVSDSSRCARRAAMRFQETGDESGAAEAQIEIGYAQLAAGNVTEAREYFAMARSSANEGFDVIHRVRSLCLEAIATFLYGNYSYCFELCDQAASVSGGAGLRSWKLFAGFLRGRCHMELGRYTTAVECFDTGIREASVFGIEEAQSAFILWYARACAYEGTPDKCLDTLDSVAHSPEREFFAAEALDMLDRADEALVRVRGIEWTEDRAPRVSITRPDWRSGFSGIEERANGNTDTVFRKLVNSYTGYLLGRTGETDEAIQLLRGCTRTLHSSEIDPHVPLYYFWYANVLPKRRIDRYDDQTTEIGRSVKIVQQRLSRIEQHTDKLDYRNRNVWFGRLFEAARKHNLV
ncbi:MAG: hypothetical protein EA383_14805 [Spirochaetaceae bacterium]|nr:MAG: hypothetical protein EA383_14805 [Spirochaetaceae bacterium]